MNRKMPQRPDPKVQRPDSGKSASTAFAGENQLLQDPNFHLKRCYPRLKSAASATCAWMGQQTVPKLFSGARPDTEDWGVCVCV